MKRTPVFSSNIKSIGHNNAGHQMEIEFTNGSIYLYQNVPWELFTKFLEAPSKGSFFAANIKDKYTSMKHNFHLDKEEETEPSKEYTQEEYKITITGKSTGFALVKRFLDPLFMLLCKISSDDINGIQIQENYHGIWRVMEVHNP